MRKSSELKFNPIKFSSIGLNGNVGKRSVDEIFRSSLAQNICYSIRNTAKSVNEIADALGVSPVYVESEIEFLEEYGLLIEDKGKYTANFIIDEPSEKELAECNVMYKHAAKLFAGELYDELVSSGILYDDRIICNQTDEPLSLPSVAPRDSFVFCNGIKEPSPAKIRNTNFILWSLIPFIAARSGEELMDDRVTFEEVATLRPDGGHNIIHAAVMPDNLKLPEDYVHMKNWCGPMWNMKGGTMLWQIDSEWSDRAFAMDRSYQDEAERVIALYDFEKENPLSRHDYAWLSEKGYIKTAGDLDRHFCSSWQPVILEDREIMDKLLSMGTEIKRRHKAEFDSLKAPVAKAKIDAVPDHLKKVVEYELQFTFHSDGWFILHCVIDLLNSGKLKPPTEGQRKALTTVLAHIQ